MDLSNDSLIVHMGTARARSDVDARCDRDAFQKAIFNITFVWCKHVCISSTRTIIKNTSFSFRLSPSTCTWSRGRIFSIYYFVCPPRTHKTTRISLDFIWKIVHSIIPTAPPFTLRAGTFSGSMNRPAATTRTIRLTQNQSFCFS